MIKLPMWAIVFLALHAVAILVFLYLVLGGTPFHWLSGLSPWVTVVCLALGLIVTAIGSTIEKFAESISNWWLQEKSIFGMTKTARIIFTVFTILAFVLSFVLFVAILKRN